MPLYATLSCILALLGVALALPARGETLEKIPVELAPKEHPLLFVERSEKKAILERARRHPWAKRTLEDIRSQAEQWLSREPVYPPSTGRHSVVYICPMCKEPLETLSATRHRCPSCRKVYSGHPYDDVLYKNGHESLRRGALTLALAAFFFDEPAYARKSLDILLGYADRYEKYPLVDTSGKDGRSGARIFDQTLNEAIWIIDIAWAYDLILGSKVGTEAEHRKVEERLLRPSVETIRRYRAGKSNWQTWHNAGIAAVALCLRDKRLLDLALNDPECGFAFQMANSVTDEGAWYEGSWSYHFYALSAVLKLTEACRHSGIDLYRFPQVRKMLEAPMKVLMPDGRFPPTHDGGASSLPAPCYEIAAARYGDPEFASVLAGSERKGYEALLVGIDAPKKASEIWGSLVLPATGAAVLRRGNQYLWLDYGPHGGGHGHLDKLSVLYYTGGTLFAPDLGRGWPYNLPIHREWYKMTLSHNTVSVDGLPQKESAGRLESSDFSGEYHTIAASADDSYEGVRMRRTLAMGASWLLDIFEVESEAEHTYDWVWHGRGEFQSALAVQPAELSGAHASYRYLEDVRRGDGSEDWRAEWKLPEGRVYGLFRGSPGRQAFLCRAPDNPRTNTLRSVILRERGRRARFVALFSAEPMSWQDLPEKLRRSLEQ